MAKAIKWQECYSVGHPGVDAQHKQLLELINNLYEAKEQQREHAFRKDALERLIQYATTHFKYEEELMKEASYPHLEEHRASHARLRQRTVGLRTHLELVTASDVLMFLKDWWLTHIQEEDKAYSPYMGLAVAK